MSCHLTVGVHPVTRHALLETLLAIVADEPELRTSLPLGVDVGDPVGRRGRRRGDRGRADRPAALGHRRPTWPPGSAPGLVGGNRPAPVAPLAQAAALDRLDADSVLAVRRHMRHVVDAEGDEVVVRLPDRTLRLPLSTAKAVRALLDGERLRVADLPGLDAADALVLARRLVREAVVVVEGR